MLESLFNHPYQRWLIAPVVRRLKSVQAAHANVITVLAVFFGTCSAVAIIAKLAWLAVVLLLLSGYLDSLDGAVARSKEHASTKGAVLDIVGDRVVEFAIIFALFYVDPLARAVPAMMMLGATLLCVTSFLVVGMFSANAGHKSFHYSVGLMERAEAFVFFIAMIVWPSAFVVLAWIYVVLVLVTAVHRVWVFASE